MTYTRMEDFFFFFLITTLIQTKLAVRLPDFPATPCFTHRDKNISDAATAELLCYKNLMLRVVLGGILTEAAEGTA